MISVGGDNSFICSKTKGLTVLSLCTNDGTPPQIADVSFIANTSNQGISLELVKHPIKTSR